MRARIWSKSRRVKWLSLADDTLTVLGGFDGIFRDAAVALRCGNS